MQQYCFFIITVTTSHQTSTRLLLLTLLQETDCNSCDRLYNSADGSTAVEYNILIHSIRPINLSDLFVFTCTKILMNIISCHVIRENTAVMHVDTRFPENVRGFRRTNTGAAATSQTTKLLK